MSSRIVIRLVSLFLVVLGTADALLGAEKGSAGRPNILLIVADDLGYGDVGAHGCRDIPTPHLDSIAASGVRCTSGYVSAPQCGPTRAGLLTGRYQQRFGHEYNRAPPGGAMDLGETTLADRLKAAGYATGLVGKWHLGLDEKHHPLQRGFDEFFGFLGGANPYLPRGPAGVVPRILRGREPVAEKAYLTDAFAREAVAFIDRHRKEPFFLYLAFNAPHGPLQATEKYLKRFETIEDEKRRTYAAMVSAMDDAVGAVLAKLRETGLDERTLIVFISDNGGPTDVNASSNAPFRGVKGEVREGGHPRAVLRPVEGNAPRRQSLRSTGDPARHLSDGAGRRRHPRPRRGTPGRSQPAAASHRQSVRAPARRALLAVQLPESPAAPAQVGDPPGRLEAVHRHRREPQEA